MQHHIEISKNVSEPIQKVNSELMEAYENILTTIKRIQRNLNSQLHRTSVQSNMTELENCLAIIQQCATPWCFISIACDSSGQFSIQYSFDGSIERVIGTYFTEVLLRRIHDFTPGILKTRVHLGSLNEDCFAIFQHYKKEAEKHECHTIQIENQY